MCISATVLAAAALATAVAGTAATIDNANYQAKMAEFQLKEQRDALRSQREGAALQALEAQLARINEFEVNRARNLAMMAGSGVVNHSYLQGIEKDEEKRLRYDLTNIRLGQAGENNRIASQIRSTNYASVINQANRQSAVVGSLFNLVGQGLSIGFAYSNRATPPTNTGTVTVQPSSSGLSATPSYSHQAGWTPALGG